MAESPPGAVDTPAVSVRFVGVASPIVVAVDGDKNCGNGSSTLSTCVTRYASINRSTVAWVFLTVSDVLTHVSKAVKVPGGKGSPRSVHVANSTGIAEAPVWASRAFWLMF
ncbi:unnamed protein product [Aphanomyces euteiches]